MIGHKIDNHFEPGFMSAFDKRLKLSHAVLDSHRQVGADVIIVADGIWRAGFAFHHTGMTGGDTQTGIVGGGSVFNDTGIPYMSRTQ